MKITIITKKKKKKKMSIKIIIMMMIIMMIKTMLGKEIIKLSCYNKTAL